MTRLNASSPPRTWAGLLIACLAGNLVLGGWLWQRSQARSPALELQPALVPARPSRTLQETPPLAPGPATVLRTHTVPFHWSMLESDDYAVYIANLRRVGCPEPLIRDMIADELRSLYADRPLPPSDPPDFWAGGEARQRAALERSQAAQTRDDERNEVYRALLGVGMPVLEPDAILEQALVAFMLDFLQPDRRRVVLELLQEMDEQADRWREEIQGIVLPDDERRLLDLYAAWRQKAAGLFSPWEIEEMVLRFSAIEDGPGPRKLQGLRLTGSELRQVFLILWEGQDPLFSELAGNSLRKNGPDVDDLLERPDRQEKIARFLGPSRGAVFRRNLDPSYEPLLDFDRNAHLTEDIKGRLYEAHRVAVSMAEDLRADPGLSEEERAALLDQVRATLELAVQQNLKAEQARQYLDRTAGWRQSKLGGSP